MKRYFLILIIIVNCSMLWAQSSASTPHKQWMIDLINSKEYEQAARELSLVEDWIFDPDDERMYINVGAGIEFLQYVDTLNIYIGKGELV